MHSCVANNEPGILVMLVSTKSNFVNPEVMQHLILWIKLILQIDGLNIVVSFAKRRSHTKQNDKSVSSASGICVTFYFLHCRFQQRGINLMRLSI